MSDRKIICKILVGSRLYGTQHKNSDHDYLGVFLPSTEDLLGVYNCPKEMSENVKVSDGPRNTKDDIDCKYTSLQRFFILAAQGQSKEYEMLFAPWQNIIHKTHEWDKIIENRHIFLSQSGIKPFVGFALAQARKSTLKGENLRKVRSLIASIERLSPEDKRKPLSEHFIWYDTGSTVLFGNDISTHKNEFGFKLIRLGGRDWDANVQTKSFLNSLKELEGRYGTRSEIAAAEGIDSKSLMNAYRLLFEADEFLNKGKITLPLSDNDIAFLHEIRLKNAEILRMDHTRLIEDKIRYLEDKLLPKSKLRKKPNMKKINSLCTRMLKMHLDFGYKAEEDEDV